MHTNKEISQNTTSDVNLNASTGELTIPKIIGIVFCLPGFFLIASYYSFLLLDNISIGAPNIYMYKFWGNLVMTRNLGIHFWAVLGVILLLGCFLFKKKEPIIFNKIIAGIIDGLIFIILIFSIQAVIYGEGSFTTTNLFGIKTYGKTDYFLEEKIYLTKIIVCSLFFMLYYFFGQFKGGTFGSKLMGVKIISFDNKRISLLQAFYKTLYYSIGVWSILLFLISKGSRYFVYIGHSSEVNNTSMQISMWVSFAFILASGITLLFDSQNRSLAEIVAKTRTSIIQRSGENKSSSTYNKFQEEFQDSIPGYEEALLLDLHKLIEKEKRAPNEKIKLKIIDSLKSAITNKDDFNRLNKFYNIHFKKTIIEHLNSIDSNNSIIHSYVAPLIDLGICENDYPHRIL